MGDQGPRFADRESSGASERAGRSVRAWAHPVFELTVASCRTLDEMAMTEFGIPGVVLMENAARGLVRHALELLGQGEGTGSVAIVCGPGNNGGDGLALARHLANRGLSVTVVLAVDASAYAGDAATNLRTVLAMRDRDALEVTDLDGMDAEARFELVVDALFGTGLSRGVTGRLGKLVGWVAGQREVGARLLSVDVPSGLDADSGRVVDADSGGVCVRADRTATLSAVKPGLVALGAQKAVGELVVCDIGVPVALLRELGRRIEPGPGGRIVGK